MCGFPKTCVRTNALYSAVLLSSPCLPVSPDTTISGRPTEVGVSRSNMKRMTPAPVQAMAGAKKHQRQLKFSAMKPQATTASAPPMECEVFQIDMFVASRSGGNQCVIARQQGGKPMPCTQP